jgi:hypothetical protein
MCLCKYSFCILCVLRFYFFKKKNFCVNFYKKYFYVVLYVRTYSYTFERVHGAAFVLALVSSTATPLFSHTALHACVRTCLHKFERITHTHTHAPARVRLNVLLYVRTYSVLGQREQFFRSVFFSSFPFPSHQPYSPIQHLRPSPP